MTFARLPINELKLVAWHELLRNESIESYTVAPHDDVGETTMYFNRFGEVQVFRGLTKAFDGVKEQMEKFVPVLTQLGEAFENILSQYSAALVDRELESIRKGDESG